MDIKKILLMVSGVSAVIGIIGFVASKLPAVSGLLAEGALAKVLASRGGAFGGSGGGGQGGLGWGRDKKNTNEASNDNEKNKKKQTGGGRGRFNHGPRTTPRTTITPSSSFLGGRRSRRRGFF